MAKELPYFKFEPNQWENGNIQYFNRNIKGLFIDLCSMYWSRLGELDYALALQKLSNGIPDELELLMQKDIFTIHDGKIVIEFMDEQLNEFQETSIKRVKAANKRWENKADIQLVNASALQMQTKSNAIREEEKRKEEIKKDIKFNFKKSLLDLGIKENLVNDWMIVREKLKAINTETSFLKIKNQLLKITDGDINSGIEMAIENSWKGFEYSWYLNKKNNLFNNETDKRNNSEDRAEHRIGKDYSDF